MKKWVLGMAIGIMAALVFPLETEAKQSSVTQEKTKASGKSVSAHSAKKASGAKSAQSVRKATRAKPIQKTAVQSDEPWNGNPNTLGSTAVLVMDQATGRVLLEKNPDMVSSIASITKLMTAMVALDAGQDMEETISISNEDVDYQKNSRSRLRVGISMSRDTALLLALMSSENRAANALGRHYPGGLRAFVAGMNQKARSLGLRHTHFIEPTGLSSHNVSTPRELAKLVAAAYRYPKIREYSTMAQAELDTGENMLVFNNTNALVRNPRWQIGLSKTGYISESGRCLVMQTWVSERPVVMVLLDSAGKMTRVGDAARIRQWMEFSRLPRPTGA